MRWSTLPCLLAVGCVGGLNPEPASDPAEPFPTSSVSELPTAEPPAEAPRDVALGCEEGGATAYALPPRIWRLTRAQVENTYASLAPEMTVPFRDEASRERLFDNGQTQLQLTQEGVEALVAAAEANAPRLRAALAQDLTCLEDDSLGATCVTSAALLAQERLLRRPLRADEISILEARVTADLEEGAPEEVLALHLQVALSHPESIYRTELGEEGRLRPFEVANLLSYTLTRGPPDAALERAAREGRLSTPAEVKSQARRLLEAHPDLIVDFIAQIFQLSRIEDAAFAEEVIEGFERQDGAELHAEARAFLASTLAEADTLEALFTSTAYAWSERTERHYAGLEEATSEHRRGLLGHPAFLAGWSRSIDTNPVGKGIFMRTRLFCQDVPPPPPVQDVFDLPDDPDTTLRQKLEAHVADPNCAACHLYFDPLAYPLEAFDPAGRARRTESGQPVDSTGYIHYTAFSDGPLAHAGELAEALAGSRDVAACFTRHAYQYLAGRSPNADVGCTLQAAFDRFRDGDGSLETLFVELLASEVFLSRR